MPPKPVARATVTLKVTSGKRSHPGSADTTPTNAPAHRQPKGPSNKELLATYERCAECGWQAAKDGTHMCVAQSACMAELRKCDSRSAGAKIRMS